MLSGWRQDRKHERLSDKLTTLRRRLFLLRLYECRLLLLWTLYLLLMTFGNPSLKYGPRYLGDKTKLLGIYWLEATIESTILHYGDSEQHEKANATVEAYKELQHGVETLQAGGKHMREDVEKLKETFAALLDLCGIKDADIPVFDESNCNRQSLITSFGTMSKKSPHCTPRRREPVLRDPSVYGDMLIDYLMAQPDSDTSQSPPDDSATSADAAVESELQNNEQMSALDSPRQYASCPSQEVNDGLTPVLPKGGNPTHDHENILSQTAVCSGGQRTSSHCTTDSGVAGSEHLNIPVAWCYSQQGTESPLEPHAQNRTSGSTPELPAAQSATCFDILYASMFDSMDDGDSVNLPIEGDAALAKASRHFQNSPVQHEDQDFSDKERSTYTTTSDTSELRSSQSPRLSSACEDDSLAELSYAIPVAPLRSQLKSQPAMPDHRSPSFIFCEPLVVCLPPEPTHKSVINKQHLNMDKHKTNCKPHVVCPAVLSERPPLPPRRPLTEAKVRRFTDQHLQPICIEVSSAGRHGIRSYYSEKKVRRYSQQTAFDDLQHSSSQSKQTIQCEQCVPGNTISSKHSSARSRHSSAQSRHDPLDDPVTTLVGSPKTTGYSNEQSRKPQLRQPQMSLTRSESASKRRRGNDKLPVKNSHQDRPLRSARQRLKFISPTSDIDASPDSENKQIFPKANSSEFAGDPRKVQAHVCRMLKHHEQRSQSPQQFSQSPSPRKPSESYIVPVGESDLLTSSNNFTARATDSSGSSSCVCLPSRDEELLDRHAYYSDFAVNRHFECYTSSKSSASSSNKENDSQYSLEYSEAGEISPRQVIGSECLPSNTPFKVPPSHMRAPRTADQYQRFSRSKSSKSVIAESVLAAGPEEGFDSSEMTSCRSDSSSQDYPGMSNSGSSNSHRQTSTRSSLSSRSSSRSSRVSSHKSHKPATHPMASSTLISDSSYSYPVEEAQNSSEKGTMASPQKVRGVISKNSATPSPQRVKVISSKKSTTPSPQRVRVVSSKKGTPPSPQKLKIVPSKRHPTGSLDKDCESVITWTINDEFSDYLDTSCNVSQSADRSKRFSKRRSVHMDRSSVTLETVHKMPSTSHCRHADHTASPSPSVGTTAQPVPAVRSSNSMCDKHGLAASQSSLQTVNSKTSQLSNDSNSHSTTPLRRNNAKVRLVGKIGKESDLPENASILSKDSILPENSSILSKDSILPENVQLSNFKHVSASEPDLRHYYSQDVEEYEEEDVEEVDHTLLTTDVESTCDSLPWQRQRRSSTSSTSSCTAARCRPLFLTNCVSQIAPQGSYLVDECSSLTDLMDSILTDSPRSVNSSGIYAPHNSYTSPVRSADSHTGYSSTVSSSVSADTNQVIPQEYPIIPPPIPYKNPILPPPIPCKKPIVPPQIHYKTPVVPPSAPYNQSVAPSPTVNDRTIVPSTSYDRTIVPPATPDNNPLTERNQPARMDPPNETRECTPRPFTPLLHVNHTATRLTRNQGVTAEAPPTLPPLTLHQPQVVIEASSRDPAVVLPHAAPVAPPKVKDKNSLVRKLKQFSSHFTRRTEKLQTLANL